MYTYKTEGVCSREIQFNIENNKIKNLTFVAGCPGNTLGLCALVEGMDTDEVIKRLKGINCGNRGTSCPDQLAKALEQIKDENK